MTPFEIKALRCLSLSKKEYDDADPDDEFKLKFQFVEEAARELGLEVTRDAAQDLAEEFWVAG